MKEKKSFALRVDGDLYAALEKWAQDEFRSVNGQIEWILHQQLKVAGSPSGAASEKRQDPGPGKK